MFANRRGPVVPPPAVAVIGVVVILVLYGFVAISAPARRLLLSITDSDFEANDGGGGGATPKQILRFSSAVALIAAPLVALIATLLGHETAIFAFIICSELLFDFSSIFFGFLVCQLTISNKGVVLVMLAVSGSQVLASALILPAIGGVSLLLLVNEVADRRAMALEVDSIELHASGTVMFGAGVVAFALCALLAFRALARRDPSDAGKSAAVVLLGLWLALGVLFCTFNEKSIWPNVLPAGILVYFFPFPSFVVLTQYTVVFVIAAAIAVVVLPSLQPYLLFLSALVAVLAGAVTVPISLTGQESGRVIASMKPATEETMSLSPAPMSEVVLTPAIVELPQSLLASASIASLWGLLTLALGLAFAKRFSWSITEQVEGNPQDLLALLVDASIFAAPLVATHATSGTWPIVLIVLWPIVRALIGFVYFYIFDYYYCIVAQFLFCSPRPRASLRNFTPILLPFVLLGWLAMLQVRLCFR